VGALGVTVVGFRMNGYTMTDRKLDLFTINHLQSFALFVLVFAAEFDTPSEYGLVGRVARCPNHKCGLKYPGGILVFLRFDLGVN
jgi:hypothetical protein